MSDERVLKTLTQSCAWAITIWIFPWQERFLLKLVQVRILPRHTFSPNSDTSTEADAQMQSSPRCKWLNICRESVLGK